MLTILSVNHAFAETPATGGVLIDAGSGLVRA